MDGGYYLCKFDRRMNNQRWYEIIAVNSYKGYVLNEGKGLKQHAKEG